MVEQCHEKLQQGYVMETVREGDFTLSYLLYFEDLGVSGLVFLFTILSLSARQKGANTNLSQIFIL